MNLKQIKIGNFKSIKQSQIIGLSSQLVTLIGKNGSGKTNILDALFALFDTRTANERAGMDFRFYLELSNDDLTRFKDVLKIEESEKIIEAYSSSNKHGLGINIDCIKSTFLNDLMHNTEESIYSISKELKKEMNSYKKLISDLSEDSSDYKKLTIDVDFSVDDIINSSNYGYIFSGISKELDDVVKKVSEIISERKKGDELILSFQYLTDQFYLYRYGRFELRYTRPKLTKFEQKHITINEEKIIQEIENINQKSAHQISKITDLYDKLKLKLDALSSLVDERFSIEHKEDTDFDRILSRIIKICNPKIYYLRNENSQLFFRNDRGWNAYYHSVDERTILETFIKYKYRTLELNDINKKIEDKKLSTEEIQELSFDLETFINENLPTFEKNMIQKIKVSEDLSFSIVEKTGEEIPFSSTNSGRRWFYTYFFVQGCLQPGDILLMDEPANNLHPEAQIYIRKSIEEISKKNKIIMTTHSPYMISPNSYVYYVDMREDGTNLLSMDNIGMQKMARNLGIFERETIIGDILINNELLSFDSIGQRIKELLKEKGIKQREVAEKLGIEERELRRKLKGEHLTFYDVEWFCKIYEFNPIELLLKKQIK